MPKILPLLEQKQKQLYDDLQVKLALNFNALRTFFYSGETNADPQLRWALIVAPSMELLIKVTKEYDDLINALILEKE